MNKSVTKDDYQHCNDIAAKHEMEGYHALSFAFEEAYKEHTHTSESTSSKALELLAKVCSLCLRPNEERGEYIYIPAYSSTEGRSVDIEDFSTDDLAFLTEISQHINSHVVKARIEHILWTRTREIKYAKKFVAESLQIPIYDKGWNWSFKALFAKALYFSTHHFRKEETLQKSLEQKIIDKIESLNEKNSNFVISLAGLLSDFRLTEHAQFLASKFEGMGQSLANSEDYDHAERCYELATRWQLLAKNVEEAAKLQIQQAECKRLFGRQRNGLVYRAELQEAILILQRINRTYKEKYLLHNKIREWQQELIQIRPEIFDNMSTIRSEPFDISLYVNNNKKLIAGKDKKEALDIFLRSLPFFELGKAITNAVKSVQDSPLLGFITGSHYSTDGRQIAHSPGIINNEQLTENHPQVQAMLYLEYRNFCELCAHGLIIPLLSVLHLEHDIIPDDFAEIVYKNPFIPKEHAPFFVRGLYAGFNYDYALASLFLATQLETMFRNILHAFGENTICTDNEGNETEKSLNALLKSEKLRHMLGENLSFELEATFCHQLGLNLRNNVAHGLTSYPEFNTYPYMYAWWLVWRLLALMHHSINKPCDKPERTE